MIKRIIELEFDIGEKVYYLNHIDDAIWEYEIKEINVKNQIIEYYSEKYTPLGESIITFTKSDIGKTIFRTMTEAENFMEQYLGDAT